MAETLDSLSIEITANANAAAKSVKKLADSMSELANASKALQGLKMNVGGLVALKGLASAFKGFENVKISGNIAKQITNISEAADKITNEQIDRLQRFADALAGLRGLNLRGITINSGGITAGGAASGGAVSGTTDVQEASRHASRLSGILAGIAKLTGTDLPKKFGLKEFGKIVQGALAPLRKFVGMFSSLGRAMGRIALYRAMRTAIKEITQAAKEGVSNLYYWSKAMGGAEYNGKRFSKIMDGIATSTLYLKNALGTFLANFVASFAGPLDALVDKIVEVINQFNNLMAYLRGDDSYNVAIKKTTQWGKETDKTSKKLKNLVFGFDELNIIPAKDAAYEGSFAKKPVTAAVDETDSWIKKFEELKDKMSEYADKISTIRKSVWLDIIPIVTACGAAVAALTGHPALAATLLGISLFSSLLGDDWSNVNTLGKIIGKLLSNAIKVISIAGGAYLALKGHPFLGAALIGFGLVASSVVDGWDGTLSGLPGLIAKLTGYAISIASIVGGLYLALHGHVVPGLALMAVGVMVGLATASWDEHTQPISALVEKLVKIVTPSAMILGGLYAMIQGHMILGLGLLAGAGIIIAMNSGDGWSANVEKVVGGVKKVWVGVKTFWEQHIAPIFTKEWWIEKWDIITGTFDDWKQGIDEKFETLKSSFSEGGKGMMNNLIGKLNEGANKINQSGFMSTLNKITGYEWFEKNVIVPIIPKLAEGGIPNMGSLFIAGEAGPEFVGSVGGQTQVYNEDQLSGSLATANEPLIEAVLSSATALIAAINNKDLTIGDRDIASSATRGNRLNGRAMVV